MAPPRLRGASLALAACLVIETLLLLSLLPGADAGIPRCRTPPQGAAADGPQVIVWGQQTMIAFGSGWRESQGARIGVEGPWLAPLITGKSQGARGGGC